MRVLIAEDDVVSRCLLGTTLQNWGYEVVALTNGREAWELLQAGDPPQLVVLDWMMPEMDGVEICRKARDSPQVLQPYIILLTARGNREDVVQGLAAGADDYILKPFDRDDLLARERVLRLQAKLAERVRELETALANVKQLQGLLPICSYCKNIRNDRDYWQRVEDYVSEHSDAVFSHGICPDCYQKLVKPELDGWYAQGEQGA